MELEELGRDGTRPRTGHCRDNMSRAGRRLKNGYSGKKVYNWEVKWREYFRVKQNLFCWGNLGKL